jgi:hypothetical protein
MMRFVPVLVGAAVVAASAVDTGWQSGRWSKLEDLSVAAERLQHVKTDIGDWRSENRELDAKMLKKAGVEGNVSRLYVNRKTGARVQMLLICGRPGPISVHEPDVCYTSAGYERIGELQKVTVGNNEFKAGKYEKGLPQPDALRILWGWTVDGNWSAPDNPRWAFGRGTNSLFKLYVIRQSGLDEGADSKDSSIEFLEVLLPELKRCLAPTS